MDAFATRTSLPHLPIAELHGCHDRFGMDGHCPDAGRSLLGTPFLHRQVQPLRLNALSFCCCNAAPSTSHHTGLQL